jgi:6-phosphogluconolactonase (cycloisomerase 2 family)
MVLYVAVSGENKIKCYPRGPGGGDVLETACPGPFQLCVSPDGRFLFAVSMDPENLHLSFSIDQSTGGLTHISTVAGPVPEGDGCYISTDRTGRWLLTAYYGGGCVSALPVSADGVIGPTTAAQVLPTTRGCHSIQPDALNRCAYAACVAAGEPPAEGNAIFTFSLDASSQAEPLRQMGEALVPRELVNTVGDDGKNSYGNRGEPGPRHFCLHPSLPLLYTVDEQGNTVTCYAVGEDGVLGHGAVQSISTLPTADTSWSPNAHGADSYATSEIAITQDGRCLYAGNRHQQAVAGVRQSLGCFSVGADGRLTAAPSAVLDHAAQALCIEPAGGINSSSTASTVYACGGADDGTGVLTALTIDPDTAALTKSGQYDGCGPGLMCVVSHPLPQQGSRL